MDIIVALDSFKGNMPAPEACGIVAMGLSSVDPLARIHQVPLADGGEGTSRALTLAAEGEFRTVRVTGPLGDPVDAKFGLIDGGRVAALDMASASGIELVPADKLDPLKATTYGTGELIRAALDAGVEEIILGIGGSATVDGGVGMALALGFEVLDSAGKKVGLGGAALDDVAEVRVGGADPRIAKTRIRVACDVTNPLTGEKGAARVFGPQKGATPAMVERLDAGLARLGDAYVRAGLAEDYARPGDGAAGGLGAALRVLLGATIESGAMLVMRAAGFFDKLAGADLVITGEGMTDVQTAGGKLCSVVAREARAAGVPVALLSGGLGGDVEELLETFDYAVSIACGQVGLEKMIKDSKRDLRFAAANLARSLGIGARGARRKK